MVFGHKDLPDGCQADANGVCEWNSTPAKASSINYATVKLKMSQTVLVAKLLKHDIDAPTLLEKNNILNTTETTAIPYIICKVGLDG